MELNAGTVALVTGANGGIGQAIARALAREGAQVVLSGRRREALEPLAQELGARVVVADLERRDAVAALAEEAGEVDLLVANAALPASGPVLDFTEEQLDRALEVNLRAPMALALRLARGMAARGRGHVVFVSSISGKIAAAGTGVYSATKFGLRGFSLGLRADLRERGVGVTTVFPGFIRDAGMFAATGVSLPPGVGTRSPEEVAEGVLRGVREDLAEVDVAALEQRLAGLAGSVAPGLVGWLERKLPSRALGEAIAERQSGKR